MRTTPRDVLELSGAGLSGGLLELAVMEFTDTLIAAAAFILSAIVFFRDRGRGERQDELASEQAQITRRLAAIEQDRRDDELRSRNLAELSVRLLARPTTTTHRWTYHWVISNSGNADAHNIHFEANSVSPNATGKLPYRREQTFPIEVIVAKHNYEFPGLPKQEPPPYRVVLRWSDGEGDHELRPLVTLEHES